MWLILSWFLCGARTGLLCPQMNNEENHFFTSAYGGSCCGNNGKLTHLWLREILLKAFTWLKRTLMQCLYTIYVSKTLY